jgi:hypothetical protein
MSGRSRLASAAAVGSLVLLGTPDISSAQGSVASLAQPVGRLVAFSPGAINGVVRDETGAPVAGATVSVLGATTSVAVTDRDGRFELRTLSPGPYLVHAHLNGYVAPRAQLIDVRSSGRTVSSIALRHAGAATILAADMGAVPDAAPATVEPGGDAAATASGGDGDHNEVAWRIRHARRSVLKEVTLPDELLADGGPVGPGPFARVDFLGRAVGSSARLASSLLTDTSFSGQVNLLTAGSFDTPQQLFSSSNNLSRGIADIRLGAAAGSDADWTVRGALNQADISSWIVAGSYATRSPARHKYDVGMSYSAQRYDGGNPLSLRDVTAGSRSAGVVYAFETFTIAPSISVTYGARYAQYDYLDNRNLLSPRIEVTTTPAEHLRVSAQLSRRALAPGAEEFLPPSDSGVWLPPQRTFSSIAPDRPFEAEHATHTAVEVERDVASSTISFGVFHQSVDDQLVTVFGADVPDRPGARLGQYLVGNAGAVDATGCSAALRTTLVNRIHGSVAYSMTRAQLMPSDDLRYLILLAPSAGRRDADRIHDVSTSIETSVPETATRVMVVYRISNAFARPAGGSDSSGPGVDSRFDVQVRQSLPFMNFSNARWEMLLAVRNFFRETTDQQSVYDELLVVRPPKRIVGGVTMRF